MLIEVAPEARREESPRADPVVLFIKYPYLPQEPRVGVSTSSNPAPAPSPPPENQDFSASSSAAAAVSSSSNPAPAPSPPPENQEDQDFGATISSSSEPLAAADEQEVAVSRCGRPFKDLTKEAVAAGFTSGRQFANCEELTGQLAEWGKQHGVAFTAVQKRRNKGRNYARWACYAHGQSSTKRKRQHQRSARREASVEMDQDPETEPIKQHRLWSVRCGCPAVVNAGVSADGTVTLAHAQWRHCCPVSSELVNVVENQKGEQISSRVLGVVAQFVRGGKVSTEALRSHLVACGLGKAFSTDSTSLWRLRRRVHALQVNCGMLLSNISSGSQCGSWTSTRLRPSYRHIDY